MLTTLRWSLLLVLFATASVAISHPDEDEIVPVERSFTVGGVSIIVPAPSADFVEVGDDNRELMEVFVPSINRLVSAYVLKDDLPLLAEGDEDLTLERYGMVQAYRAVEKVTISTDMYESLMEGMDDLYAGDITGVIDKQGEEFNNRIKELDDTIQVEYEEPIKLGRRFSFVDVTGYGIVMPMALKADGEDERLVMAATISIIRVNDRLIYVYIYAAYKDIDTIKWLDTVSEQWCKDILRANQKERQSKGPKR